MCISVSVPSSSPCNFFPCYLSIWHFCYVLPVPVFFSKIVLLPLHPIIGLSWCFLLEIVGKIFFRYFEMSYFVYIAGLCLGIFKFSFLSPVSYDLYPQILLFDLAAVLALSFFLVPFPFLIIFHCCRNFFIWVPNLISHPGFEFLFVFLWEIPILPQTNFAPV